MLSGRDLDAAAHRLEQLRVQVDGDAMAETFAFLARYYRGRFSRVIEIIRGATIPLMVFAFAVPVAWLAISLMLPMAKLIDTVGPYRGSF